jgi:hypothetical protein
MRGRKRDEDIREELKAASISAVLSSSTVSPRLTQQLDLGSSSTSLTLRTSELSTHIVSFMCIHNRVQLRSKLQLSGI